MTTPPDIADLIAQLESATSGSRELDARIYGFLNGIEPAESLFVFDAMQFRDPKNIETPWRAVYVKEADVPAYSDSIDAAISLIPEGWTWGVSTFAANEMFNPGGAQAYARKGGARLEGYAHADARTAPLALCVASLHARLAISQAATG